MIKSLEITFETENNFPLATIYYTDKRRKSRQVVIEPSESSEKIDKGNYRGRILCGKFYVILCEENVGHVFDSSGKSICSRKIAGRLIHIDENHFSMLDGRNVFHYDLHGNCWKRILELTDEELYPYIK